MIVSAPETPNDSTWLKIFDSSARTLAGSPLSCVRVSAVLVRKSFDRTDSLIIDKICTERWFYGGESAHPEGLVHAPGVGEQQVRPNPESLAGPRRGLHAADEVCRVPIIARLRNDGAQIHDRLRCTWTLTYKYT